MRTKTEKNIQLYKFPFRFAGSENIAMFILALMNGICMILQVYIVSDFIDSALHSVENAKFDRGFYLSAYLLVLSVAVDWLCPRIINILRQRAELKLKENYRPLLIEKCAKLKYRYVEQTESWDLISRVLSNVEKQWMDMFQAVLSLLQLAVKIVGILMVIAGYIWWAALVILLFCIPLFGVSVKSGKKNYQAQRDTSELTRRYDYFDLILRDRETLDERKLFGYSEKVDEKYAEAYQEAFWIATKTKAYWVLKTKMSGALSCVAALLIIITLIQPTLEGIISVGLFISLVNSVFSLTGQMSWGLSRNIDALVNGREFCKDMKAFSEQEEEDDVLELPEYIEDIQTIEFKKVHFRYPGTEFEVLRGVSFRMEMGKHYALVGKNGAGKTTIIKLLTGLYPEYEGEILINGKELRSYTKAQQKGMFSVVYQDYIRHALSFRENCQLGVPCGEVSEERIKELFDRFDLSEAVEKLPDGLDTPLGKIKKDSVDLSGGQWQKLAMVRALLGPEKVRILDEPTAALDPRMESEVYGLFQQMTEERLTILISHRLGFASTADEIIVFADGRVSEKGDFHYLMEQKGLFYQMYEEQRSWYE